MISSIRIAALIGVVMSIAACIFIMFSLVNRDDFSDVRYPAIEKPIRIESWSTWGNWKEETLLRPDGSGYYAEYEIREVGESFESKAIKIREASFAEGELDFEAISSIIGSLQNYSGTDWSVGDFMDRFSELDWKPTMECGKHPVTDNSMTTVYWDWDSFRKSPDQSDNLTKIFSFYHGCQSRISKQVGERLASVRSIVSDKVEIKKQ